MLREMDDITIRMKSEINNWKQSLGNMSNANLLMKSRLSTMLQENFNINLLPQVENLYSHLLSEEDFVNLLRHNIQELDSLIESENSKFVNTNRVENMCSALKAQMMTAKIRLTHLQNEFEEFFLQASGIAPH